MKAWCLARCRHLHPASFMLHPLVSAIYEVTASRRACWEAPASADRGVRPLRLAEALQCVGLVLVDAEHGEEIGQLEGLAHAVLRLEEDEVRAQTLRHLEALHQLAEAVAVDVIHVREVEQDLAVSL